MRYEVISEVGSVFVEAESEERAIEMARAAGVPDIIGATVDSLQFLDIAPGEGFTVDNVFFPARDWNLTA